MEPIRSTDYFVIIPTIVQVSLKDSSQQSESVPLLKALKLVTLKPMSNEAYHERVVADISLLGLMIATAIFVTIVILNWSH